MLLAHALLAGKALGPHQGFYLPYLAAYVSHNAADTSPGYAQSARRTQGQGLPSERFVQP